MVAVVDCNNFFVSCEVAFNPALRGQPVVVASNNDGVIVSRSQEAKALGIPMGAVIFKWRNLINRHNVKVFSGNFPLYGDMSRRVMDILESAVKRLEIYSIDEAFLNLDFLPQAKATAFCLDLREKVLRCTGIPVSIGIAPTKTLAKAAAEIAKKNPRFSGVYFSQHPEFEDFLAKLPVEDIWGIGRGFSELLKRYGIRTAAQFKYATGSWIKEKLHLPGYRTQLELKGISCVGLSETHAARKGIISSRSFGRPVREFKEMQEAVSLYATKAAERLRSDGSVASIVQVYITTNRFRDTENRYSNLASYRLEQATAYTPRIITAAKEAVKSIFVPGLDYKKAVVMPSGISPKSQVQLSLFWERFDDRRDRRVMQAVDILNRKWGRSTMSYAASGIRRRWRPNAAMLSRNYTTSWADLPVVKAK